MTRHQHHHQNEPHGDAVSAEPSRPGTPSVSFDEGVIPAPADFSAVPIGPEGHGHSLSKTSIDTLAEVQAPAHDQLGHATIGSSMFNIASSAIGAGSLSFPYAFAHLGIVPGLFVVLLSAAMCVYTIAVLIRLVEVLKTPTYEQMGEALFGRKGRHAVGATAFSLTFGIGAVYCVLVGQFMEPILELASENSGYPSGAWGTRLMITMIWLVFMLPWCLMKSIDSLKYISAGAVFAILVVIVALIVHAATTVTSEQALERVRPFAPASLEMIQGITNMKVGFTGQIISFAVYHELSGRSEPRMLKASVIAISICVVVYTIMGIAGVIAGGLDVTENILASFDDPLGAWYSIAAYASMLVVIVVSFPIVMFPARDAILAMMGYATSYDTPDRVRIPVALLIATGSLIVGLFVPSLNLLFGVLGGISGNLISNFLPAVFALQSGHWTVAKVGWANRIAIFVPLVYGVAVGPAGLAVSIYLTFRTEGGGDPTSAPMQIPAVNATIAAMLSGVAP